MRVFNETSTIDDPVRGKISIGGYAKKHWLRWCSLTFQCKPVEDFFESFRFFHLDRHNNIECALDGEKQKEFLLQFESGIKQDLYSLLSHFDNVLNDPTNDWKGQDHVDSQEAQEPQVNSPPATTRPMDGEKPGP